VELADAGAPVVLDATMPPIAEGWAILELVFLAAAAKASRVFGPDDGGFITPTMPRAQWSPGIV